MNTLWEKDRTPPAYPSLSGDVTTDVLVIGGGMAGVLCARKLKERGIDCLIAEASTIGSGTTKGTTAVLSAQHDTLYQDLIRDFGSAKAKQYLDANLQAIAEFRSLAKGIPCDFEEKPSYMYSTMDAKKLEQEAEAVQSLGFDAKFIRQIPLPFPVIGAVVYPGMAEFHPLKFLYGAVEGLNILEHTLVRRIDGTTAYTDGGKIRARKVIVATHFPILNKRGLYFMKMHQTRSYVVALENAADLGGTYVGAAGDEMYFRNYKGLLLVGGGDHRTGTKGGGFPAVREFIRKYFQNPRERYAWAAQDCMSLDGVPYIGPYSPATPNIYVATGFNEWGMTSSMAAASILADMITGRKNEFASVFAPDRSMLHAQLFANLGVTLFNFVLPTVKRCPHLGCTLKWNPTEHTWDCPCHGSRFDENGKLIDNPATKNARV